MSTARALAEQAVGRELAVLVDGPWSGCWYWRGDLEGQQHTSHRMHRRCNEPLAAHCHYLPTETWVEHPSEPGVRGRAWTYQPSADNQKEAQR